MCQQFYYLSVAVLCLVNKADFRLLKIDLKKGCTVKVVKNGGNLTSQSGHLICIHVFYSDVFCGYLLCTNIGRTPRIGTMKGDVTPTSFNHQGRVVECR